MGDDALQAGREPRIWRLHSDTVNAAFLRRALSGRHFRSALKTDLFDETVTDGIVPVIREAANEVTGIDFSSDVVDRAKRRDPRLTTRAADIRQLPFEDGSFDLVVSFSTIDHLGSLEEMQGAVLELARVLSPEGTLVLTVDNKLNPIVAIRGLLPGPAMRRLGLVAYPVGPSVGPRRLEEFVRRAGLRSHVQDALMHCPRLPAVALARRLRSSRSQTRFLRTARRFEALDRLPSRYLTGYFAAVIANR
jgi:SAM-dependent methyltransferase